MATKLTAGASGAGFKSPIVYAQGAGVQSKYRYRNGIGMMNSAEFLVFHDDFIDTVTSNVPTVNNWTAVIDTGATVVSSAVNVVPTGGLTFDSDGGSEGSALYLPKIIELTSGKQFFMEIRFKTEAADDTDVQFGLSDLTATTNPEDLYTTTAANLIAFGVLDGDATVGMLSDAGNGGTTVQLGTKDLTSNSWHTLGIGYNGSILTGWVDGDLALTWSGAAATIPTGVLVAPFVAFRNGSTANNEGYCDYLRYAMER